MVKFKLKFSPLILSLLIVCALLSGVGVAWNVFNIISYLKVGIIESVISNSITAFLSLVLLVFCFLFIFCSGYTFKDKKLISTLGAIKNKLNVEEIRVVHHLKNTGKIVLLLKNGQSTLLTVNEADVDGVIKRIMQDNDDVIFQSSEENKKDKKS